MVSYCIIRFPYRNGLILTDWDSIEEEMLKEISIPKRSDFNDLNGLLDQIKNDIFPYRNGLILTSVAVENCSKQ